MKPEDQALRDIDRQLAACGWTVQDRASMNIHAGPGVAVPEFPVVKPDGRRGSVDYLLYANGKAIGVVEAKPADHCAAGPGARAVRRPGHRHLRGHRDRGVSGFLCAPSPADPCRAGHARGDGAAGGDGDPAVPVDSAAGQLLNPLHAAPWCRAASDRRNSFPLTRWVSSAGAW